MDMEITWLDYCETRAAHTVTGKLRLLPDVYSPQLDNRRDLLVHLPTEHGVTDRRYPVLYMHDGQNLFDAHTSFAGEWEVDETMAALEAEGLAAIIVGLPNAGAARMSEYSPFPGKSGFNGRGDAYLRFIVETVKPLIDAHFQTLPDRAHTGLMGSSMGGLISLYGYFSQPEVFGLAGVVSPSLWVAGRAMFPYIERQPYRPGRLYMDCGTAEDPSRLRRWLPRAWRSTSMDEDARHMRDLLRRKGYHNNSLHYVEEIGGAHNEATWARRLPDALRFLLG